MDPEKMVLKTKGNKIVKYILKVNNSTLFGGVPLNEATGKYSFYSINPLDTEVESLAIYATLEDSQLKLIFGKELKIPQEAYELVQKNKDTLKQFFKEYLKKLGIKFTDSEEAPTESLEIDKTLIQKKLDKCVKESLSNSYDNYDELKSLDNLISDIIVDSNTLEKNFNIFSSIVTEQYKRLKRIDSDEIGTVTSYFSEVGNSFIKSSAFLYNRMQYYSSDKIESFKDFVQDIKANPFEGTFLTILNTPIAIISTGLLPIIATTKAVKHIKGSLEIHKNVKEKTSGAISGKGQLISLLKNIKNNINLIKEYLYNLYLLDEIFDEFKNHELIEGLTQWDVLNSTDSDRKIDSEIISYINNREHDIELIELFGKIPMDAEVMNTEENKRRFSDFIRIIESINSRLQTFVNSIKAMKNYNSIFKGSVNERIAKIKQKELLEKNQINSFLQFKDKKNAVIINNLNKLLKQYKATNFFLFLLTGDYQVIQNKKQLSELSQYKDLLYEKMQDIYEIQQKIQVMSGNKIQDKMDLTKLSTAMDGIFDVIEN